MSELPLKITLGDKYEPAMSIERQRDADEYFERLVEHSIRHGLSREEAESLERQNLGYFAGYYNTEVRARVERLFHCEHPIFGAIASNGPPTPEAAFTSGVIAAAEARRRG